MCPFEIVISDDNSSDNSVNIISNFIDKYGINNNIILNVNDKNLGFIGNFNKCVSICNGDIIIYNAGDDISFSERTEKIVEVFSSERPLLVHTPVVTINGNGKRIGVWNPSEWIPDSLTDVSKSYKLAIGASCAYSKELFDIYGFIDYPNTYEDLTLFFRSALKKRVSFLDFPLVYYRIGQGITTKNSGLAIDEIQNIVSKSRVIHDTIIQRMDDLKKIGSRNGLESISKVLEEEHLKNYSLMKASVLDFSEFTDVLNNKEIIDSVYERLFSIFIVIDYILKFGNIKEKYVFLQKYNYIFMNFTDEESNRGFQHLVEGFEYESANDSSYLRYDIMKYVIYFTVYLVSFFSSKHAFLLYRSLINKNSKIFNYIRIISTRIISKFGT